MIIHDENEAKRFGRPGLELARIPGRPSAPRGAPGSHLAPAYNQHMYLRRIRTVFHREQ
jgi:hypothetical protein